MNLDELLKQIREEGKKDTALAAPTQYVGEKDEDLVDEEIDEVILRILGIEDVKDIDYSTYKSLLREKMAEGRMVDSNIPTEEVELITDEFKRVKRNTGRFKVKKKGITASSVASTNATKPDFKTIEGTSFTDINNNESITDVVKGVTPTDQEEKPKDSSPETPKQDLTLIADSLAIVATNMNQIVEILKADLKTDKKKEEKERKETEKAKKRGKEENLEGQSKKFTDNLKDKVMSPVFNIFDFLGRFLKNVLLGGVVVGLIKLLQNPAKILNPLINLLNNIINTINLSLKNTFGIMFAPINALIGAFNGGFKFLENQLNNVLKIFGGEEIEMPKIPIIKAPQIPNVPLIKSPTEEGGDEESKVKPQSNEEIDKKIDSESEQPETPGMAGGGVVPTISQGYEEGGDEKSKVKPQSNEEIDKKIDSERPNSETEQPETPGMTGGGVVLTISQGYEEGGYVNGESGEKISGMGADTQLIAAQPGEIVMSKGAVEMFGADSLLAMNAMGGGTNKPKMGTPNLAAMTTGGMVPGFMGGGTNKPKMGTPNLVAMTTGGMVPGFMGGGMVGVSDAAEYDVIIPLDHVRPENIRSVPDTPGGNTYDNASATGAAGREREHQDPAVNIIARRLRDQGLRVMVYTPEMAGDYQTYDNFIKDQASKGTRIAPIHFDAAEDKSGEVVGTGFLTRTRSGDTDDATFAAPIQKVLTDFQKNNPDLGNIDQDTESNKTVRMGSASPTALIELGMMTRWEKKYGKNFTETKEFKDFAMNVADAMVVGGGFDQPQIMDSSNVDSPQMKDHPGLKASQKNLEERFDFLVREMESAQETSEGKKGRRQEDIDLYRQMMRPTASTALAAPGNVGPTLTEEQVAQSQAPLVPETLTKNDQLFALNMRAEKVLNMEGDKGTKEKIMVPGVGSFVSGTGFFGGGQDKYFSVKGYPLTQEEFHDIISWQRKRLEREKKEESEQKSRGSSSPTPSFRRAPTFSPSRAPSFRRAPTFSPSRAPQMPAPPTRSNIPIVINNEGGAGGRMGRAGGSVQRQKSAPFFSSMDPSDPESIVIRSIYNIIG